MTVAEKLSRTGPKTPAGKEAVARNLPHPVKHGLRTRTWQQFASTPCHPGSCCYSWEDCDRRAEAEQGCPVLREAEHARLEALVADLDPAEYDPHTGELLQPAGSNLSLVEIDALAEYERLGTVMLVVEAWFRKAGMVRASQTEGLALQGAAKQYLYCAVVRDRMRERHGWTKRRGEQQTDLAAAILAVAVRRKAAPSAPTAAIEAECRVLPASDEEEAPTPPQGAADGACDVEVVP